MIDVVTWLYSFKTPTGNIRSTILVNYICIIVITMFINEFVNYILDSYIWYILGCSISKYDLQWSYCGLSPAHPPPPQPDCLLPDPNAYIRSGVQFAHLRACTTSEAQPVPAWLACADVRYQIIVHSFLFNIQCIIFNIQCIISLHVLEWTSNYE